MLLSVIILAIIIIILSIPLKFRVYFEILENNFKLKLSLFNFEFDILPQKEKVTKKKKVIKNNTKKEKKKSKGLLSKIKIKPINSLKSLTNNPYKPKYRLNTNIDYSLGDPALSAQSYGLANAFIYTLLNIFNLFLDMKSNKIEIRPNLNTDNFKLNLDLNCILYISFTQIIIIGFLLLKNLEFKVKE